jgi:tetratricopeptide (TPR) repeat protein/DNA-binding MarR family transcriptional regulator
MSAVAIDKLVLVGLGSAEATTSDAERHESVADCPHARTLSDLADTVGGSQQRLSQRIELASAIDQLEESGLVERHTPDGGRMIVELTDQGVERAEAAREELETTSIEVVGTEGRRTCSLGQAAREFDRSLVELAAACSSDHVYQPPADGDDRAEDYLVGRQAECSQWSDILDQVHDERTGQTVLLTGPSGIGKTELADELLAIASRNGFSVSRARCLGPEADPFHPVRTVIPADETPDTLTSAGRASVEAQNVTPEEYERRRAALFYDLTDALAPPSPSPPHVVCFDDLHLADPGTLAYLSSLLEQIDTVPILLLLTYRPTELPADAPVGPEAAMADRPVTRMPLQNLDRAATSRLVEHTLARRAVPDALVGAIHERTGGNPLFVEATVQALLDSGQLDPHLEWYPESAAAIDLPGQVQTTLAEYVETFEGPTQELLSWAAVAGEAVPVAVLQSVSNLDAQHLHTRLSVLVATGVLEWDTPHRTVKFHNEAVRNALLDRLSGDDHRRRHERIAGALEAMADAASSTPESAVEEPARDRTGAIASHYEQAGRHEQALTWYRQTAEQARTIYATEAAIEACESALALARDHGDTEPLLAVGQQLAALYARTGRFEQARRYVQFVRERTPEADSTRRQQLAHLAARIANNRSEYDTALDEIEAALAISEKPSEHRCQLLATQADVQRKRGTYQQAREAIDRLQHVAAESGAGRFEHRADQLRGLVAENQGDYQEAREHLTKALAGYEALGDRHEVATIHNNLGMVAQDHSTYEDAREHYRQALSAFAAVDDRHGVAKVHNNLGIVARKQGAYDETREHYQQALSAFEAVGDRHSVAILHHNLGNLADDRGDYEAVRDHYQHALAGYEAVEDHHGVAMIHNNVGIVARKQGAYDEARAYLQQARATLEAVDDSHNVAMVFHKLGSVAQAEGAYDEAREHYQRALASYETVEDTANHARTRACLGVAAAAQGDTDKARAVFADRSSLLAAVSEAPDTAALTAWLGRLARYLDEFDQARALTDRALARYRDLDRPHQIGWCRLVLARVAVAADEHDQAREHAQAALERFEAVSAPDDQLAALDLLVETARAVGDDGAAREWTRQVQSVLDRAPAATVECHDGCEPSR